MLENQPNLSPNSFLNDLHHRPLFSKIGKKLRPSFYPHNLKLYKNIDARFSGKNSSFGLSQDLELSTSNEDSTSPKSGSLFIKTKMKRKRRLINKRLKAKKESPVADEDVKDGQRSNQHGGNRFPEISKNKINKLSPNSRKSKVVRSRDYRIRSRSSPLDCKTEEEKIQMLYTGSDAKKARNDFLKKQGTFGRKMKRGRKRRSKSDVIMLRMIQPQNNASWKDKKMNNRLELFIDHRLGLQSYKLSPIEFRQRNGRLMKNMKRTRFRNLKKKQKTLVSSYC